jgi:hypothetical protein
MIRSEIEDEIKILINSNKNDTTYINPLMFSYLNDEELIDIRDNLLIKKDNNIDDNRIFLDELYKKIKLD